MSFFDSTITGKEEDCGVNYQDYIGNGTVATCIISQAELAQSFDQNSPDVVKISLKILSGQYTGRGFTSNLRINDVNEKTRVKAKNKLFRLMCPVTKSISSAAEVTTLDNAILSRLLNQTIKAKINYYEFTNRETGEVVKGNNLGMSYSLDDLESPPIFDAEPIPSNERATPARAGYAQASGHDEF